LDCMDWNDLAQNRDQWRALLITVMNLRVPWNAGKFLSGCTTGSFSRRAQLHEWVSQYPRLHSVELWDNWQIMNWKLFVRRSTIQVFVWRDRGNPWRTSGHLVSWPKFELNTSEQKPTTLEVMSSPDSDTHHYIIIRKLLDCVSNQNRHTGDLKHRGHHRQTIQSTRPNCVTSHKTKIFMATVARPSNLALNLQFGTLRAIRI
jgi:hypothetical protein